MDPTFLRKAPSAWTRAAVMLALCLLLSLARANEYRVGPTPDWVTPIELDADAPTPADKISGGVYYLLSDSQYRAAEGRLAA